MIRMISLLSSSVLLAACATAGPAPTRDYSALTPAQSVSVEEVAQGFGMGVIEGCVAAAEAGKTLEQLASPMIKPDTSGTGLSKPPPGYTAWTPALGKGNVMMRYGEADCQVSTFGLPIQRTFETVAAMLRARGYEGEPVSATGPKEFHAKLTKSVDGRQVEVVLSGNEPGAPGTRSRFSTALSFVRVVAP